MCHGQNPRYPNKNSTFKSSRKCPKYVEGQIYHYPIGFQKLFMVKNLLSLFFGEIFVLRFQDFHSAGRNPRYPNENSTLKSSGKCPL